MKKKTSLSAKLIAAADGRSCDHKRLRCRKIRSVCAGSGMERGSRSDTDVLHGSIVRSTCNQKKCTYPYDGI